MGWIIPEPPQDYTLNVRATFTVAPLYVTVAQQCSRLTHNPFRSMPLNRQPNSASPIGASAPRQVEEDGALVGRGVGVSPGKGVLAAPGVKVAAGAVAVPVARVGARVRLDVGAGVRLGADLKGGTTAPSATTS